MWRKLTHFALGTIVIGALFVGSHAKGQTGPRTDQRSADELQRLVDVATAGDDIEERISAAQAALELEPRIKTWTSRHSRPWLRGALLQIMGTDLQHRPTGDHEDNLDKAIAAYQKSLKILTKDVSASDWATTQNNLGLAYLNRKRGGQAQNQERAVVAFEAAQTGYVPRSESWAMARYNSSLAYTRRQYGDKADNIEKAIKACEDALTVYTKESLPEDWARAQRQLGVALTERVAGNRSDNSERAIKIFEDTLKGLSRQDLPLQWVNTQFELAKAYSNRVIGDRADNIERAISGYEQILTADKSDLDAATWASTQGNIAIAYTNRLRGDRADNIERSIKGYEAALSVFTREAYPGDWANQQDLLGSAYSVRIRGSRIDNLEQAIQFHEAALTVYTRERVPREWAHANANLAGTYVHRLRGFASENSKRAIEGYEAALTVLTRKVAPLDWAMLQGNLGMAFIGRPDGDPAENQERAIKAYEASLSVYSREAFPEQWAHAKANLSKAYAYRIRGNSAENLQRAIEAAQSAVQVYTPASHPRDFLGQVRLLGPAYVTTKNVAAAESIYAEARRAFLLLFGGGLDDAQAQDLMNDIGPLFSQAAYVAADQGQAERALGLLNEGKARLMAVALRQLSLELSPRSRERYQNLQADIRHWSDVAAGATGLDGLQAIRNLEASRNELLALIESGSAGAAGAADTLEWVGPLVPDRGAIIAPIVTHFGGKILIVRKAATGTAISVVPLPDFSTQRLREVLRGSPDQVDAVGGWMGSYAKNYEMQYILGEIADLYEKKRQLDSATGQKISAERTALENQIDGNVQEYHRLDDEWRAAIDDVGAQMWDLFAGALDKALREHGIAPGSRIVWMPPGALGMLPLGLAQDPGSKRRFGDDYEIAYIPSLVALKAAKDQLAKSIPVSLLAVANPTGNLGFAEIEGSFVASYFNPRARIVLKKDEATPKAVFSALKDKTYWHFSTHGAFSWESALSSTLLLSDGSRGSARLTIRELLRVEGIARPRLVVLSACETGLFDSQTNPDEFTGLPSAFMSLGAVGVLGTLWLVDDRASMLLTSKFYDLHLRGGLAPPEALRRAQDWLRGAKRRELVAYTQEAAKAGRVNANELARIAAGLRRSDMRVRLGSAVGGSEAGANVDDAHVGASSTAADRESDVPPYAHPYFWGGFVYTGL